MQYGKGDERRKDRRRQAHFPNVSWITDTDYLYIGAAVCVLLPESVGVYVSGINRFSSVKIKLYREDDYVEGYAHAAASIREVIAELASELLTPETEQRIHETAARWMR